MSKKGNIAFVHYPHHPDLARMDTMPFVLNTIKKLADAGWNTDVYLWENSSVDYSLMFPKNVKLLYQDDKWLPIVDSILVRMSPIRYKENTYRYRFRSGKKYNCVFGAGQIGAFIAHLIAKRNNAPLILFNDEFPSAWRNSAWTQLEKNAAKNSRLIVVPDESRIKILLNEYGLPNYAYAVLPNVGELNLPDKKIDWHAKLNIPNHLSLCLHAGSIDDFAQVPELMMSVSAWPENTALVLHGRNKSNIEKMQRYYGHLNLPGKIFWNTDSLSEEMLNSLVSYSKINFGLYRNRDSNLESIGFSSGKIMRSIASGIPVIASNFNSLSFIHEHGLGILVNHPNEIAPAVSSILNGDVDYKYNCRVFYETYCMFDKYWNLFVEKLVSSTGISI